MTLTAKRKGDAVAVVAALAVALFAFNGAVDPIRAIPVTIACLAYVECGEFGDASRRRRREGGL